MSTGVSFPRDASDVPLNLTVTANSGSVTGLTAVVAVRRGESATFYLDFADDTFKTSGWTTRQTALADLTNGTYTLTGGLDVSAITNLPTTTNSLVAEYEISGARDGVSHDIIVLSLCETEITDVANCLFNRLEVNLGTQKLELYNDAGTVVIQRWPLTTDGGESVSTQFGVQTKRGSPEL